MSDFKTLPEETIVLPRRFEITLTDDDAYHFMIDLMRLEDYPNHKDNLSKPTKDILKFLSNRNKDV